MSLSNEKVIIIAAVIVIAVLSMYTGHLRGEVRRTTERADESLHRAEACEDVLAMERRAHTAAIEAQGYADKQRQKIEATRADFAHDLGAIVDSGKLDDRVCELARAAYHSALCTAADSQPVPATAGAGTP